MPLSPCKDCISRCVGCHGSCKPYTDWKAVNDEVRERRQADDRLRLSINEILFKDYEPYKYHKRYG